MWRVTEVWTIGSDDTRPFPSRADISDQHRCSQFMGTYVLVRGIRWNNIIFWCNTSIFFLLE